MRITSTTDPIDATDAAIDHLATHLWTPEGVDLSADAIDEGDGIEAVVVRLMGRGPVGPDAWQALEEAVDLSGLGLRFADGGPLGGPWLEGGITYTGGTYQRWEVAQ